MRIFPEYTMLPPSDQPTSPLNLGTTAEAVPTTAIPVPPPQPAPIVPAHALVRGDRILILLTLGFAFLLASSPVRNSDFWLHLASGKFIWEGGSLSANPFSYTPSSGVNNSWLYDLLVYLLYAAVGGTALVIIKALGIVVLTGIIIRLGWKGTVGWLASLGALLSLLVLGPWLAFRPLCVSYLFLALTLWILSRSLERNRPWLQFHASLFLLFLLWVNMDGWFFLGPMTVGLYFLAELLPHRRPEQEPGRGQRRNLGLALLVGLAMCLINPSHGLIFLPAPQLSELAGDVFLRDQLSPLHNVYFSAQVFRTGPGMAYWILVFGGVASFAPAWSGRPWRRIMVFCTFFALSLYRSQAIPFFAVIAGPVLALNLADLVAGASRKAWLRLGRATLFVAGLCLVTGAWVGWFQPGSHGPRIWHVEPDPVLAPAAETIAHVWHVEPDPVLASAAETIAHWRQNGKLGNHRGFHLTPEAANFFAWFCPEEKCFADSRWRVSPDTTTEYLAVRAGLLGRERPGASDWRAILRRHNINHVVVYSGDLQQTELAFRRLVSAPEEWVLLHLKGGTAIFGWRDADQAKIRKTDPFLGMRLDLDRAAFDPSPANRAPLQGPEGPPEPYRWWDVFWRARPTRSADLREAQLASLYFDFQRPRYLQANSTAWNPYYYADLIRVGASLGPIWHEGLLALTTAPFRRDTFFLTKDKAPLALPYLAIRAARRALSKNPDDFQAFFALARAYDQLSLTRELSWQLNLSALGRLRSVQTITALRNTLRLRPDLVEASDQLARVYWFMNYKDFALKHLKESLHYTQRRGPHAGESADAFAARLAAREARIQQVAKEVGQLQKEFDISSQNMRIVDRARLAAQKGLASRALEELLSSDVAAFGTEGMDHELKLLLSTGDAEKVRRWMDPEKEKILDTYHWNKAQMHAAAGDYELADRELAATMKIIGPNNQGLDLHVAAGLMMGSAILAETTGGLLHKFPLRVFLAVEQVPFQNVAVFPDRESAPIGLWNMARELDRAAHTNVLRGLLAMEAGRIARAREHFQEAIAFWNSRAGASFAPRSPAGLRVAQECLEILETSKR